MSVCVCASAYMKLSDLSQPAQFVEVLELGHQVHEFVLILGAQAGQHCPSGYESEHWQSLESPRGSEVWRLNRAEGEEASSMR